MVVVGGGGEGVPVVYDKSPLCPDDPPPKKKEKKRKGKQKKERERGKIKNKKWLSVLLFPNEKFDLFLFELQNLKGFFSDPSFKPNVFSFPLLKPFFFFMAPTLFPPPPRQIPTDQKWTAPKW